MNDQGGLNKKEIQLNLCYIFSILILNWVKLGHTVTFMKYIASVVSLIFAESCRVGGK